MYQALYRKYRPKNFSDVYGQDHVTSTLKNEIKEKRISHAYLFTGSRGTGKTTCAKILAKAVNCENCPDGEPCNECEVCKGLDGGTIYDVVEIDAASNNGVDNIRDLREEANYTPSRGKYRVYIIDEVHMLSTGAFNALLKTLEEPPAHVIFILATTEVHKLPATILSRCQRFDFKRIQPETMAVRLKQVAAAENLNLTDDAAILIARIADGALRDGLSILDQCSSRDKNINSDLVSEVAGIAGREVLYQFTQCVQDKNSSRAIEILADLYQNSYDMERLCVELINHFRNFLIVKTVKKSRELIICTDDEYNSISGQTKLFSLEKIILGLDLFQDTLAKIKAGANSRIEMEMSFIKLCEPKLDSSINAVLDRISSLETKMNRGVFSSTVNSSVIDNTANSPTVRQPVERSVKKETTEVIPPEQEDKPFSPPVSFNEPVMHEANQEKSIPVQPSVEQNNGTVQQEFDRWAEFMDVIHKNDIALFGVLSGASGYTRGDFFLIDSNNPVVREFIKVPTHSKAIKQALHEVTGKVYKLGLFKRKTSDTEKRDLLEDLITRAQNDIKINFE